MLNKMWLGTELYNGCFGKNYSQKEVNDIVSFALDIGVDRIDTAECYGVEKTLGIALNNKRTSFKISTKFGHKLDGLNKINAFDLGSVKKQLSDSLKYLGTDYIDLYYFHSGSNLDFKNVEVWEYLRNMQEKGVIGELGLSLQHSLVVDKDHFQVDMVQDYGISTIQTVLNMYSKDSLEYVIPFCRKNKIKVFGRMPLAKGLLSGKYKDDHVFDEGDCRYGHDKLNENIIKNNKDISVEEAIKWCLKNVDEIVIGSKTKKQLVNNFDIINCLRNI